LPSPFTSNVPRFRFYAHLVKRLEIYESPNEEYLIEEWVAFTHEYLINEWGIFIAHTWQTPLLPNLKHLSMRPSGTLEAGQARWLIAFLSPTLTTIEVLSNEAGCPPEMSYLAATLLLDRITQRCPRLETLSIFPHVELSSDNMDNNIPTLSYNYSLPYEYFGHFKHLSELATGRDVLKPDSMTLLGSLPQLATLEIHSDTEGYGAIPNCPLSSDSFPRLKRLLLRELGTSEMRQIWRMEPLVQHITVAELHFNDDGEDDEEPSILFTVIANTSRHIDDITIRFDSNPSETILCSLLSLSPLLLRRMSFSAHRLDLGSPREWCQILSDSFPLLRHLHIPTQVIHFKDLVHFTKLQKLEVLSAKVQWPSEKQFRTRKSSASSLKLSTLECGLQPLIFPLPLPLLGDLVR
jgi:hypothetical protein